MTNLPPSTNLADLPASEFVDSFATWIDARVATLTDEIQQRNEEIKLLTETRRRLVEFGHRQEETDAG